MKSARASLAFVLLAALLLSACGYMPGSMDSANSTFAQPQGHAAEPSGYVSLVAGQEESPEAGEADRADLPAPLGEAEPGESRHAQDDGDNDD